MLSTSHHGANTELLVMLSEKAAALDNIVTPVFSFRGNCTVWKVDLPQNPEHKAGLHALLPL